MDSGATCRVHRENTYDASRFTSKKVSSSASSTKYFTICVLARGWRERDAGFYNNMVARLAATECHNICSNQVQYREKQESRRWDEGNVCSDTWSEGYSTEAYISKLHETALRNAEVDISREMHKLVSRARDTQVLALCMREKHNRVFKLPCSRSRPKIIFCGKINGYARWSRARFVLHRVNNFVARMASSFIEFWQQKKIF